MAVKKENSVVSIEYEVKVAGDDKIIDSNKGSMPLEFITGKGHIIPGLEKALEGMEVGESKKVFVKAQDAYGEYNEQALQKLPKEQFEGIDLQKGMTLYGQGENGETIQVVVKDFDDEGVVVDFNHPLAGKDLEFDVKILSERDATQQEIESGQVESTTCHDGSCGCH
ncbi:MAG: peptidylprolyl isomerase [Epsilonproteobacteria bacterium]|jgi:FKBP-type peptidyl-prolyl cis-trans isomerase SlyD|nr:peptidylprolyl isomerase [Campylobacterota bacterium]